MNRIATLVALFLALVGPGPLAQNVMPANGAVHNPPESHVTGLRFDPTGQYYIAEHDSSVRDSFTYFELWVRKHDGKIHYSGHVRSVEGVFFHMTSISCLRGQLTFQTERRNGTHFEFSGRFVRLGVFWREASGSGPIFLKGRLTRKRYNSPVYSYSTDFRYYAGC